MLHHFNPVSGLLAVALFLSAPVQAALPAYSAVKDEAKTVNKYMIVVWAGTDWSPKSREITRAVEHLAKNSPEPVLWCIQDEREEMTEEEQKLPKPPGEIWNIPAIQVVSPCGKKPPLHPERPRPFFTEKGFSSFLLMRPLPERIFWKKSRRRIRKTSRECTSNTRSGICPTSKKCREW